MDDRRPAVVAVVAVFQALSWVSVAVRLCVRHLLNGRRLGWDDLLISVAMVPVVAQAVLQLLATKHGLGIHIYNADLSGLTTMVHLIWWSGISFNLAHLFIKLSYLAFYLSLIRDRTTRAVVYVCCTFVVAVGITFTTLSIFMCTPIQRGWDKTIPGTCIDDRSFLFSNAAFNMAADGLVFLLPIPTLWSLHLPLRQRLILVGTFTCGSIILVASAVRIATIFGLVVPPTQDPTWDLAPLIIWAEIEVNIAIILSCAGAFKALAQSFFPAFMDSLKTGSSGRTRRMHSGAVNTGYVLQSRSKNNKTVFQTVIEAAPKTRHDVESVDSREHIVDRAPSAPGWPRMETTISVHSSKRDSAEESGRKNPEDSFYIADS